MADMMGDMSWIVWAAGGIFVLALIWSVIQFVFKLTIKIFVLGCLGIGLVGAACGLAAFLGAGV